jgi:hypothetical protein
MDVDLKAALICARAFVAMFQPRTPPRWAAEHLEHLERLAHGCRTATGSGAAQEESELIGTAEAAAILGCSGAYIRRIAADLDGRRIANAWLFDRKAVQEYAASREHAQRAG